MPWKTPAGNCFNPPYYYDDVNKAAEGQASNKVMTVL